MSISDEEALKHITTYDAPAEGFDPNVAEDRLLRKHGIPRRPDAAGELSCGPSGTRPLLQSLGLLKRK